MTEIDDMDEAELAEAEAAVEELRRTFYDAALDAINAAPTPQRRQALIAALRTGSREVVIVDERSGSVEIGGRDGA